MHIIYLIQINRKELPNKYIGSKSNCSVIDGKIIDSNGNQYVGSSKDSTYRECIRHSGYILTVLGTFSSYEETLKAEKETHIANDVVASPEYFNKAIAAVNNYSNPDYATYKHTKTGKTARLPRNHPSVISREWVGVSKGVVLTEQQRKSRGRSGSLNAFYGRKHGPQQRKKLAETARKTFKGKPKSDEQRRKMAEARKLWWINHRKNKENRETKSI